MLFGWALDVEALKRVFLRLVAMNPVTASAFILLGLSLWLSGAEDSVRKTRLVAGLCAALAAVVGLLKLAEVAFGWAAGVDQLLFASKLAGDVTGQPNRMAPNTTLNLLLSGCALLLLNVKIRGGFRVAQFCVVGSVLASLIPVVGYAYGTRMLYGIGQFIPMALHAAVTFLTLGVGSLFARPGRGLTVTIVDKGVSGLMARRLLPAVIALHVVIGWHRDKAVFNEVIGISLLSSCVFRMRRKIGERKWGRVNLVVEPRSAYHLSGPARTVWEHSNPQAEGLRYSVTFRNLREA